MLVLRNEGKEYPNESRFYRYFESLIGSLARIEKNLISKEKYQVAFIITLNSLREAEEVFDFL